MVETVPRLRLPVQPPVEPMLAKLTRDLPPDEGWLFEPKWDGFRALVFWDGDELFVQSRDLKPLNRYFPELEKAFRAQLPPGTILDGEVVIAGAKGLDFDALLLRIHPAASRVTLLAEQTPAQYVAFDALAMAGQDLSAAPQSERRASLEHGLRNAQPPLFLTPATTDRELAALWFERFEGAGLDGVVAKRLESLYVPAERVMLKVKHQRTADCVVGAFRWNRGQVGKMVGSLLLGLYDEKGSLHHVGFTSSFKAAERREMIEFLAPYREFDKSDASTGNWFGWEGWQGGQGAQSRWSHGKEVMDWIPLRPELVCEVAFDHWQGEPKPADNRGWLGGGRFRHGTTFLRWRSDKPPLACDFDQLTFAVPIELREVFGQ